MSRACIPFHILFDKDLSKNELIIYGLIEHMEFDCKVAFFNNRTIAEKLGVSHESRIVGKMLSKLKDKGYINREYKEVTFKDKRGKETKQMRWCFSIVKSLVVSIEDDENMVPEVPPLTMVPEIPPPLVPEVPPYNNPSSLDPLITTTTTTSSSNVFNESIDKELLDLRNKHIPSDDRDNDLFLRQCKWHVDLGSKEHTFNQRVAGLKKIIRGGCFDAPATYPKTKERQQANEKILWSNYQGYVKSPIEIKLREQGNATLMSFEIWKSKNV